MIDAIIYKGMGMFPEVLIAYNVKQLNKALNLRHKLLSVASYEKVISINGVAQSRLDTNQARRKSQIYSRLRFNSLHGTTNKQFFKLNPYCLYK